jgi:hypothetical protein
LLLHGNLLPGEPHRGWTGGVFSGRCRMQVIIRWGVRTVVERGAEPDTYELPDCWKRIITRS